MVRSIVFAGFLPMLAALCTAQTVVDVSAVTNYPANPAVVRLGPGIWRIRPVEVPQGGLFTSWHPWNGNNVGCGAAPGSCTQGWLWSCFVEVPGQQPIHMRRGVTGVPVPKYPTVQDAFQLGAVSMWLPLTATTDVSLWIGDSVYGDNLGGVSVRFEPVSTPSVTVDVPSIPMSTGGQQRLTVDGGASRAGQVYFVLGSASGTTPGLPFGQWQLPLNGPDPYLHLTLSQPNSVVHVATLGVLDGNGRAVPRIDLPGPQPAVLAGLTLHHAVAFLDAGVITGFSDPVQLDLVP